MSGAGGHGGIGAIGAGGTSSGSPFASSTAAATRMTPTSADFQPPYFPPPFPTTQQQIDFHAAAHLTVAAAAGAAGDPYSLNSIHQQHYQVGNLRSSYVTYIFEDC